VCCGVCVCCVVVVLVSVVPRGGGIDDSGNRLTLIKQGVCHTVALPFTLKKYLKAKGE